MDADQQVNQSLAGENPPYDVELYERLKNAIDKTVAIEKWRQAHPNEDPVLRGADLRCFSLSGAALQGADLEQADLRGACLEAAMLQGTRLEAVNLCGVYARFTCVDGTTLLNGCEINHETDFAGVGLDSARIEGRLKARLKRNIRKHHWEGHRYHWKPHLDNGEVRPVDHDRKGRYKEQPFLWLAWPFWWASDYGSSAARLLWVFLGVSGLFALLYLIPTFFSFEPPFMRGLDTYNGQELSLGSGICALSTYQ